MSQAEPQERAQKDRRGQHNAGRSWGRPFTSHDNPKGQSDRTRLEEVERQAEAVALLADLGRAPTAMERALAAEAAALIVEARRLRKLGRSSIEWTRLLSRVLGQLGVRDKRREREEPGAEDVDQYLAEAAARHEAREAEEAEHEAAEASPVEEVSPEVST